MKRFGVTVAMAGLLTAGGMAVVPSTASAAGVCAAHAFPPARYGGSLITGTGYAGCNSQVPITGHQLQVQVQEYIKRPWPFPNTWRTRGGHVTNGRPGSQISARVVVHSSKRGSLWRTRVNHFRFGNSAPDDVIGKLSGYRRL